MLSIYFDGNCFRECESSLYLINSAKSEFTKIEDFTSKAVDYLLCENVITKEYINRKYIKSTDEDIIFMKSILDNMKNSVIFDFEKVIEYYTLESEEVYEHLIICNTEHNYIMMYWNTTA